MFKIDKVSLEKQFNCVKQERDKLTKEKENISKTCEEVLGRAEKLDEEKDSAEKFNLKLENANQELTHKCSSLKEKVKLDILSSTVFCFCPNLKYGRNFKFQISSY